MNKCIADGKQGRSLPNDFKFTQQTGSKVQNRGVWAYPVGGVLQDLIPFTPDSHSVAESQSHSSEDMDPESTLLSTTADSSLFPSGYIIIIILQIILICILIGTSIADDRSVHIRGLMYIYISIAPMDPFSSLNCSN